MNSFSKALYNLRWVPSSLLQRWQRAGAGDRARHLIFALADHFEPAFQAHTPEHATKSEQLRRLEEWSREYPRAVDAFRDADGQPFKHTYFYPAEQYDKDVLDAIVHHCERGYGEVEVHLHHGVEHPDTSANTRRTLLEYIARLRSHGCLSHVAGEETPRYAFVHGNWALANSARGRYCGVDDEMQILAGTGCYADFTLPSAPSVAQVNKINSLYECVLPLEQRAPHRRGVDLQAGRIPRIFPLILQGPLLMIPGYHGLLPGIENSEISGRYPASLERLKLWKKAAIMVRGQGDWLFIKLHCHGMDPRDRAAMTGTLFSDFLKALLAESSASGIKTHFVTAREMANIVLAACAGETGDPGEYRDFRFVRFPRGA
jgi:hypothetical protein